MTQARQPDPPWLTCEALSIPGVYLDRAPAALHVWSERPLRVLSSAVAGAELAETCHILNLGVPSSYHSDTPAADLAAAARDLNLAEPLVGMMTAARIERAQVTAEGAGPFSVAAVITVGVSRPVAAGVTPMFASPGAGTINMILVAEAQLAPAAAVHAIMTATEAKALALAESSLRAPHGGPASGTATDSIVLAWTGRGARAEYAGTLAPLGALIARAVRRAILNSLT